MDIHEVREHIEHAAEHGEEHAGEHKPAADHGHGGNKRVAVIIAALAALLAITELGASSAQNDFTALNVQANDNWNFYQAKTIRSQVAVNTATILDDLADANTPADHRAAVQKQADALRAEAKRLDSSPTTNDGRKELLAQGRDLEATRDTRLGAFHAFEFGAAALQLGVVLASAGLLTSAAWLVSVAIGLGGLAIVLNLIGWFAPTLMLLIV